ncbi:MAG: modification methylase, HemK family [Bacillales bacterium]|jgi:release factor glutamine methyltransferase|nr:modification methylase, HemK family [Bacillales bacterium]
MNKVYEALHWASSFLGENNRDQNIGELLLMHYLGISRAQLLSSLQDVMPTNVINEFKHKIEEHVTNGVPVQHIIGSAPFYGRTFKVNKDVLIPRPETEELVENVLSMIQVDFGVNESLAIADIGTGSGVIAITMQLELPETHVYAIDISDPALKVAVKNACNLGANRIEFIQGSLLEPLIQKEIKVDVLLSNPPYIPLTDLNNLQDVVRNHDPHLALFGGQSGLEFYEKIVRDLPKVLNRKAIVGFEIGDGQGEAVSELLKQMYPDETITVLKDINEKERMVFVRINEKNNTEIVGL